MYTSRQRTGLGFDTAELVGVGGTLIQLFKGLIPPRGDYQKFQRTLYPVAYSKARATGAPVLIYWFGEMLRLDPDGTFAVILSKDVTSGANANDFVQFYEDYRTIEGYLNIAETGNDNVNNPSGASFVFHDKKGGDADLTPGGYDITSTATTIVNPLESANPFNPTTTTQETSLSSLGGNSTLLIVAGIGLLAYLTMHPIRKGKSK